MNDAVRLVLQRIADCEQKNHRIAGSVKLLAVSKTRTPQMIRTAFQLGLRAFGENYLQEALSKIAFLRDLAIEWHFIGPIQRNKTRAIAEHFSWVQSVDRLLIAERLSAQRPAHLPPLNICLEVNISEEKTKSGITIDALPALTAAVLALPRLQLRGLMVMPRPTKDVQQQHLVFEKSYDLFCAMKRSAACVDTLSMGMSADLENAIACGSTMVRVGTDLFGLRH